MILTVLMVSCTSLLLLIWIVRILYRHKKIASHIINRLEQHHSHSQDNSFILKKHAERSHQLTREIQDIFEQMKNIHHADDSDIEEFIKTRPKT
jgi:hypothetical protein